MKEKEMTYKLYDSFLSASVKNKKLLAILVDPDVFNVSETNIFLRKLPKETTHIFVGGSTVENGKTEKVVSEIKKNTSIPILLFPGDVSQITNNADGLLFLSLLSGRNPEYLIEQQVKSVSKLRNSSLEVISTGYLLIDGGKTSAVERVSKTRPISQKKIQQIVDTAKAGEYLGMKLIYLEAGSGAKIPILPEIISAVKNELKIPLIIGGGIKSEKQKQDAYKAGADLVVMGTVFEK
ncbi:MAG: geranylgeranylglyceryl/heptaprenylglyceryl phosphate synthase [Flavobacteriaceae bacterium]|nr:geranylgeranylglyceryl/heptaprenylglyceryl phosphate synthase [Flavobacteriaceae bacterium]